MGIALGGKLTRGLGKKLGRRLGGKAIGKVAGKGIAKSLGKKIPLVGLGLGAIFAAQRAMQGDFIGAGLELAFWCCIYCSWYWYCCFGWS